MSSMFAYLAVPTQSAYNAAKAAVRALSESLRMELRAAGSPVGVTCVHPGGIRTSVARNAAVSSGRDAQAVAAAFDAHLEVGMRCRAHCFSQGVIMRAVGDRMIIAPPLVITRAQVDEMTGLIRRCLDLTLNDAQAQGWMA